MDMNTRKPCSRNRVRKHRALRKICEPEMREVLRSLTTSNTEDIGDSPESVVINAHNDLCQGMVIDVQDVDAQVEFVDDEIQQEMPIDTQEVYVYVQDRQNPVKETDNSIETVEIKQNVVEELRNWAIQSNIQQNHLDKLLEILRKELIPSLPKSSKTFLTTAKAPYCITEMEDAGIMNTSGKFAYFGIASGLTQCINHTIHEGVIELIFNVDGLPISNSSGKCFWPILCKPHHIPDIYSPFVVAIYLGMSKPKNIHDYLQQFIEEINDLQRDGVIISGRWYEVKLKCFVADTPARAYLKCCKCHGGYSTCERCHVRGTSESTGKGSTVVYPGVDHQPRTNASFREQKDTEHHTGTSPLIAIELHLDMPIICLLDIMHLGAGVAKKMIVSWTSGPLKVRLSPSQRQELTRRLLCSQRQVPSEFQRKPRSAYEVLKWKATEFRFFILYCGPIVLKSLLPLDLYKHFLLLHVAFWILCSDELALSHNAIAKKCLKKFVLTLSLLYGSASLVINMHNLLHSADDARNMKCSLSRINCFPFESALGALKKKLRTPNKPLSQICRRYHEQNSLKEQNTSLPPISQIQNSSIKNGITVVRSLRFRSLVLSCAIPNNMVLLKDEVIMKIEKIFNQGTTVSSMVIQGPIWRVKKSMYNHPRKSHDLEIWELHKPSRVSKAYIITEVKQKLVRLQLSFQRYGPERLFVDSLLHY